MNKNIRTAIWILYATQVLEFVVRIYHFLNIDLEKRFLQSVPESLLGAFSKEQLLEVATYYAYSIYGFALVGFLSMIYVIYETSRGKSWARTLLLISYVLSYILVFGGFIFGENMAVWKIAYKLVICIFEIVALILLFKKVKS